jgi:hypothetical protein
MTARWQRRVLQAELERWRLHGFARPLLTLIEWWAPTSGRATRLVVRRAVRVSPLARMVALAAAAVTVTAVAMLVLVIVVIVQLL